MVEAKFDIETIRKEFPILHQEVYGKPLVYFDNAASSQKPLKVINAISEYYTNNHSNVHRGAHYLSSIATDAYEEVRSKVSKFINASSEEEIVFTSGTTNSINLVAESFCSAFVGEKDEILVTEMEHHSNIVPWQIATNKRQASVKAVKILENGELNVDSFKNSITESTKLISLSHISNSLGTINPIKELIKIAHSFNIPVLIDGAQSVPHQKVNVQELDCDFYAFSAHKMYGPTGVGVLYGKSKWLNKLPPYMGGGEMINSVSFEGTTFNEPPFRFEAGTPNIAGVVGLGAAIDYIHEIGYEVISNRETDLLEYATKRLKDEFSIIRFIGEAKNKASLISFLLGDLHPYDVGTLLDKMGIAVRVGHHCTEPIMNRFGIPGTIRASFAFYNTKSEIDQFVQALKKVETLLS